MHRIFRVKAYEMEHGPHFNEEHARKAVMKMENEDGTRGPHWSLEETSALASQYGISLSGKFNRYDWFVALNMVYSDYYKVLLNITGSNNIKHYIEFAKAWLNDKDIDEGKMWYYYQYVMCDKIREAEMECYEEELEKHEEDEETYGMFRRGSRGRSRGGMRMYRSYPLRRNEDLEEYDKFERESEREYNPYDELRSQYDTYKQRKEAIAKCDEEMAKCQQLLDKLEIHNEPTNENSKIIELQNEINELKNIIKKANQMVPPPMKDMLPQDMKDAMNKVDQ